MITARHAAPQAGRRRERPAVTGQTVTLSDSATTQYLHRVPQERSAVQPSREERRRATRRRVHEEMLAGLVLVVALLVTLLLLGLQWLHSGSSPVTLPQLTATHGGLV